MPPKRSSFRLLAVIICFVAAVWMAAACGEDADKENSSGKEEIGTTTGETTGDEDIRETGSSAKELTETPTAEALNEEDLCETDSSELVNRTNISEEEFEEHALEVGRALNVRYKYDSLFWRQPNVYDVSTGFLRDGKGGSTERWGINVWVTAKIDQSTLPPEDRIPDYLEGVPVKIAEKEPSIPIAAEDGCEEDKCGVYPIPKEGSVAETTENTNSTPTDERIHEVRLKYDPLFWRQPNVIGVGEGFLRDDSLVKTRKFQERVD